jgi:hypothetical protein
VPVVKTGPLHSLVADIKAQGLDQVKPAAGRGTGSGDIAGVHRNLRLYQYDIQQICPPRVSVFIVFQTTEKFNCNLVENMLKIQKILQKVCAHDFETAKKLFFYFSSSKKSLSLSYFATLFPSFPLHPSFLITFYIFCTTSPPLYDLQNVLFCSLSNCAIIVSNPYTSRHTNGGIDFETDLERTRLFYP